MEITCLDFHMSQDSKDEIQGQFKGMENQMFSNFSHLSCLFQYLLGLSHFQYQQFLKKVFVDKTA